MSGTFISPNTCGFAQVASLEIFKNTRISFKRKKDQRVKDYEHELKEVQYQKFEALFAETGGKFHTNKQQFHKNLLNLRTKVRKWNIRKSAEKAEYFSTFSVASWGRLSVSRKREHCMYNCRGCAVRYAVTKSYFPVHSRFLIGKAKQENSVFAAATEVKKITGRFHGVKPLEADIQNTAKKIYDTVSPIFQKKFGTDLANALSKVPELDLQHENKNTRRKRRREEYRKAKENIEQQMAETALLR